MTTKSCVNHVCDISNLPKLKTTVAGGPHQNPSGMTGSLASCSDVADEVVEMVSKRPRVAADLRDKPSTHDVPETDRLDLTWAGFHGCRPYKALKGLIRAL